MKRGRNQRRRQGVNINRALDSNGPDVRIRGTANQIYDKYLALARDANSSGDRVKAENYLQHAEHYFRVIRAMQPQMPTQHINGDQGDSDGDQPGLGDGDRRFNRDQSQPGNGDDGDFDADQPESRFEPHPFAQERPSDEGRRPDHHQRRPDNRGDRNDHRGDHRNEHRNEHRNDHRRDQRHESRERRPEMREARPEIAPEAAPPEGRPEHRPEQRPEQRPENPPETQVEAPRSEDNSEARLDNDRRGRRRRRPRPPIGAEGGGDAGADQPTAGDSAEMTPETV